MFPSRQSKFTLSTLIFEKPIKKIDNELITIETLRNRIFLTVRVTRYPQSHIRHEKISERFVTSM